MNGSSYVRAWFIITCLRKRSSILGNDVCSLSLLILLKVSEAVSKSVILQCLCFEWNPSCFPKLIFFPNGPPFKVTSHDVTLKCLENIGKSQQNNPWIASGWPKKSWSSTVALIIRTNCYRWPWSNPAKQLISWYCWWKKSCTTCDVKTTDDELPLLGAEFLNHQQPMIYSVLCPLTCLAEWRDEVSLNATWSTFKTIQSCPRNITLGVLQQDVPSCFTEILLARWTS